MVKLPKTSKSSKSKGKRRDQAPPPDNFESAMDVALECEEQAERYRSGNKAVNNWKRALEAYKVAASFDATQADPLYNSARILQTLAEEHVPYTEAPAYLAEAISVYAQASTLDPQSVDIPFNHAQALMLAADRAVNLEEELALSRQALDMFLAVAQRQQELMAAQDIKPEGFTQEGDANDQSMDEAAASSSTSGAAQSQQSQTVTQASTLIVPATIVDTLLEAVDVLLSLLRHALDQDLIQQADALMSQSLALLEGNKTSDYIARELECRAVLLEHQPDAQAAASLAQDYAAYAAQDPTDVERSSAWTDYMYDLAVEPYLTEAYTNYSQLVSILSSPLTAARSVQPQSIAPTLSNAYTRMAVIHLYKHELEQALQMSLKSIEASQAGVRFVPGQGFTKSEGGRDDYPVREAMKDAAMAFARVAWHANDQAAQAQACTLLARLNFGPQQVKDSISDIEDDQAWTAAEGEWWSNVVQQL